jgi:ATP-binding cassette subfamily B protein
MNKDSKPTSPQTNQARRIGVRRGGQGPGSGMALGIAVEKAKDFKGTLKRLIRFLRPQLPLIIIMLIGTIITTIFSVITPDFTRQILNTLQGMIDGTADRTAGIALIQRMFILIISIYLFSFILELVSHLVGNYVSAEIGKNFRNKLREKLERLPIRYFDANQTGNILSIFTNDVDAVVGSIQQSLIMLIQSFLTLIGVIVMMFVISWKLTLITIGILPLYILATAFIAKKSQKRFKQQQKELGNLNGYIEEMFSAHQIIKLFGREDEAYRQFSKINGRLANEMKLAQFLSGLIRPIMEFISNFGYVLIVVIGGILAGMVNPLLIGDITIFVTYHRRFMNPILNLANMINMMQSSIAGAERIFILLDEDEEVLEQRIAHFDESHFSGKVEFKDVEFSYTDDHELIKDLNLVVEPGKQIAIVGPTGAGKTTLVNLLMRFYEIKHGMIKIDDIVSTDVSRQELRSLFGMVLQDTWLFSGTIRDNVAYGKEDVIQACKQAHVHHFIETLPHGYDTILSEDAANMSQGQKQLLTIARAILYDPKILILDEATSSVDTRTEAYIQNAMDFMIQGRTSFVIAHRLSTIKRASVILVLEKGRIVEQGSHAELLAKKGAYFELYQSQFLRPIG